MFRLPDLTSGKILIESHLFPSLNYFLLWASASRGFILETCENYQKSSYRNRYYIASVHGPVRLSVPLVKGKHQQMPVAEVRMDNKQNWKTIHWRSIQTAYGKSPFFEHYKEELFERFTDEEPFLLRWSLKNMKLILKWLEWDHALENTDEFRKGYSNAGFVDLRNMLRPGSSFEKEMNNKFNVTYEQVFSAQQGYTENLSILDLIFCTGPEASSILKNSLREQ